jgi:3-phosphoshikimate 1-carboxyvinyltransferase
VPGSKSLTNRALLLAGVAGPGRSHVRDPLIADDTEVMAGALRALGAGVSLSGEGDWVVDGLGGPPVGDAEVWCGMAGTVGRFLVPVLAAGRGRFVVDAHPQLRRRPLGPVLGALSAQGAEIEGDAFPLTLVAAGLHGGEMTVDASVSSQFLSGLLMAAPLAARPTTLRFESLVSEPYIDLTMAMMGAFGVSVERAPGALSVRPATYSRTDVRIEPDASTASYFLAAAALTGTTVCLAGLDRAATAQGDIEIVDHLVAMGATLVATDPLTLAGPAQLNSVHVEMGNSSDVFMTLACVAPFADGPTTIEGIGHARVKESDRIAACAENMRRLGIRVDEGRDHLTIHPGRPRPGRHLPTYDDHRVAMAFALIGTRVPVVLEAPGVVAKTCPTFFELWAQTGARIEIVGAASPAGAPESLELGGSPEQGSSARRPPAQRPPAQRPPAQRPPAQRSGETESW